MAHLFTFSEDDMMTSMDDFMEELVKLTRVRENVWSDQYFLHYQYYLALMKIDGMCYKVFGFYKKHNINITDIIERIKIKCAIETPIKTISDLYSHIIKTLKCSVDIALNIITMEMGYKINVNNNIIFIALCMYLLSEHAITL